MNSSSEMNQSVGQHLEHIRFEDLFNLEDLQNLQDLFADVHGVSSVITHPDGTPITKPSHFCRLCSIVRATDIGCANCHQSDMVIGSHNTSGPMVQTCLSAGLWDAGASITVSGRHIANWLIGQVRNEAIDQERIIRYADLIGANRDEFMDALNEVPVMSADQFNKIAKMLFAFAKELSDKAYQNLQLKNQIRAREKITSLLHESEERLRQLFDEAPLGYQSLDINGCFVAVNQQWLNTLGYSRGEVIGKWFGDFLSPAYQDGFRKRFPVFKAQGKIHSEFEMVHKDGHQLFIAFEGNIGYDEAGEFKQTHCILQDITHHRQAEEKLRTNEETLNTLLNGITESAFMTDIDGKIIVANNTVANRLGVDLSQLVNKCVYDFFSADVAERRRAMVLKVLQSGQPVQFEDNRAGIIMDNRIYPIMDYENKVNRLVIIGIDITEQKLMQQALHESEEKYHLLLDSSGIGVGVYSLDGTIQFFNSKAIQHLGGKVRDYIGKSLQEVFGDVAASVYLSRIHEASKSEKSIEFEDFVTLETGNFWFLFNHKRLTNSNGEVIGVQVIAHDITERKLIEEDLHKERMLLRTLIDNIPDSVYSKDLSGRKTLANLTEVRYSGAKSEREILGKTDFELYPREFAERFVADDQKVLKTGKPLLNREEFIIDEKGEKRHLLSSKIPLRDENGQIIGLVGIGRDVTERIQAEEQLILLSRAVEQSPVTVVITTKEGHIEYVNPKFTEITGYTLEEVKGLNPRLLRSGYQTRDYYKELWDTILSGKNWQGEFQNKKKSGEYYWESAVISPIVNQQGEISFFIAVKEDITEKKKMVEDLINAKEQAEESDRLKSCFLANMSHEIRTPMNGILGFTSLLKEPRLSGEEQQEYIGIIEKSGARMLNIINDIMSISKVEAGQMELTIVETNVNVQIEYLYTFFKPEAEQKGITLRYNNPLPHSDAFIKTDREKLYAILTNLVKNAIKFTNQGTIEFGYTVMSGNEMVGRDKASYSDEVCGGDEACGGDKAGGKDKARGKDKACFVSTTPSYLEFFVKDTGLGIRNEQQGFIFERFRQVSESLNRNYEGAGLGLSISKAYVEMLGGNIRVESKEGMGSTFYFTIPYTNDQDRKTIWDTVLSPSADEQMKGLKILIAEDDEGSVKYISLAIKAFSRKLIIAHTGVEAVEACRKNPDIDLVLMDIKMPEMDGWEATRLIRQFNTSVVIIAQTAYALTGDHEKAIAAGCTDYISKPIQKDRLTVLLKKYFK